MIKDPYVGREWGKGEELPQRLAWHGVGVQSTQRYPGPPGGLGRRWSVWGPPQWAITWVVSGRHPT